MSERHQTVEYWRERARVAEDELTRLREVEKERDRLELIAAQNAGLVDRLWGENEYLRVKTAQYDQMVTEVETLLAALRDAAEELHLIDENMAWEDVHRVASRLAAISEVEGEK